MKFIKKIGIGYFLMLVLCALIIVVAEYTFLHGDEMHGIFIGLWAPMLIGLMIFFKLVDHGSK
ncbi:hypothetical protein JBL43_10725 [Aureibaculum sp. A20]|uniref:Uncharacterized protein n=1 Tax=Aureibaculum flavum TaxID=2795986 RepID=A0ABS0WRX5_9FLAO|nr:MULTISPECIES: hypothetical protein [Aureibaculum]MBJ2174712.1 hypothetical protein [Aureibaculum flavum]